METININGIQLSPKAIIEIHTMQQEGGSLIDHFNESIQDIVSLLSDKSSLGIDISSNDLLEYINTLTTIGQTLKRFKPTC